MTLSYLAQRLEAIATVGLQFAKDGYDLERYEELRELGMQTWALASGHSVEALKEHIPLQDSYPTPKVDVRAIVFNEAGEMLLIREKADGCWAPPGGWADPGYTPAEVAAKECREEAGLLVKAHEVWGVTDKKGFAHPVPLHACYKIFMYCLPETEGDFSLNPGHETLGAGWFAADALPPLSLERITNEHLSYFFERRSTGHFGVLFN